ncbi:MAG: recombinase RecA, partial [Myxococcaceae bacterium]|nr:recombinase RecA [Myxococcaceae bacterium]
RLRAEIRRVHAAPRQLVLSLHTGLEAIDALGIWRLGGCVELSGELASGRTSLALKAVAAAGHEGRLSAWVDGPGELYPPAALSLGVHLERLLIVRPKAPGQLVWSAVQLLRSGAFTCVVLDLNRTGVRLSLPESKKLSDAARTGGALLVLLTAQEAQAEGLVRLVLTTPAAPTVRLAEAPLTAPGECFEVEVAHSRTGVGRRLQLQRGGLCVGAAPRLRRCPHVEATWDEPTAIEPFVRRKKNLQREGYQPPNRPVGEAAPTVGRGIRNGRPGRDAPHAPLRQLLGVDRPG